ncbi:MAG: SH3 domain-containing protein [Bacteroidales bacterium]|nr:SH3 domain-containing protein [Bacteroidales bacterium]
MKIIKNLLEAEPSDQISVDASKANEYINEKMDRDSGTLKNPDIIVLHYTGSNKLKADIQTLFYSKKQVSVQFVIDLDGTIHQLMPVNKIAWHAGESRLGNRTWLNKYSIGIEIVNAGFLTEKSDGSFTTWYGDSVKKEDAVLLKHKNESKERYWHTYTKNQIESVKELCEVICDEFDIEHIVGHDEISPGRKQDPGPAFPVEKIKSQLLDNRKEDASTASQQKDFGVVKVDKLNIRQSGNREAAKVALPLTKGQNVEIIEEKDGWYKVETKIQGWVTSDFIE